MQGSLQDFDLYTVLGILIQGQRTGCLLIEASKMRWCLFFSTGYLIHATPMFTSISAPILPPSGPWADLSQAILSSGAIARAGTSTPNPALAPSAPIPELARLQDTLKRRSTKPLPPLSPNPNSCYGAEYQGLWELIRQKILTPAQGRQVLEGLIQETLVDLMALKQGQFYWYRFPEGFAHPHWTQINLAHWLPKLRHSYRQWVQLATWIPSLDHCPRIVAPDALQQQVAPQVFQALSRWADGTTSLRRMARHLHRDAITIAQAISPYIQSGIIQMVPSIDLMEPPHRTAPSPLTSPGTVIPDPSLPDPGSPNPSSHKPCLLALGARESFWHPLAEKLLGPTLPLEPPAPRPPAWGSLITAQQIGEAINHLSGLQPFAILVDLHKDPQYPSPDGLEDWIQAVQILRQWPALEATPIFVLGQPNWGDRLRTLSLTLTPWSTPCLKDSPPLAQLKQLLQKVYG